jgi:hypothetical protein
VSDIDNDIPAFVSPVSTSESAVNPVEILASIFPAKVAPLTGGLASINPVAIIAPPGPVIGEDTPPSGREILTPSAAPPMPVRTSPVAITVSIPNAIASSFVETLSNKVFVIPIELNADFNISVPGIDIEKLQFPVGSIFFNGLLFA